MSSTNPEKTACIEKLYAVLLICAGLVACSGGSPSAVSPTNPPPNPGTSNNQAPTITGTPATTAQVGQSYVFTPVASDADGDPLTFSIENRPTWTEFSEDTGRLSGTPNQADIAQYSNINIAVSDGSVSTALPGFDIAVVQIGNGAVNLSWTAPSNNTDGSLLTDLSAYKIYFGNMLDNYPNEIRIENPGITSFVVENLIPDTYYFVATSINSNGVESEFSNVAVSVVD